MPVGRKQPRDRNSMASMSKLFFKSVILKATFSQVYDTSKAWNIIDKRVSVPILGQGAEAGHGASEYKVLSRCDVLYLACFSIFGTPPGRVHVCPFGTRCCAGHEHHISGLSMLIDGNSVRQVERQKLEAEIRSIINNMTHNH